MSLKVLGSGIFMAEELSAFAMPPAWRKATRNMVMATGSIERALAQVPNLSVSGNSDVGFVLGSSSGELETSADFLTTWSKSQMARPVLFQNSLHNATTGFSSIHFKLSGPSFTVSVLYRTPEECMQLARGLLFERTCRVCIVTLVESHKTLANWIGESDLSEGACTWIVSDEEACRDLGLKMSRDFAEDFSVLNYTNQDSHLPLISIDASGFFARAKTWQS